MMQRQRGDGQRAGFGDEHDLARQGQLSAPAVVLHGDRLDEGAHPPVHDMPPVRVERLRRVEIVAAVPRAELGFRLKLAVLLLFEGRGEGDGLAASGDHVLAGGMTPMAQAPLGAVGVQLVEHVPAALVVAQAVRVGLLAELVLLLGRDPEQVDEQHAEAAGGHEAGRQHDGVDQRARAGRSCWVLRVLRAAAVPLWGIVFCTGII
jgi:hypothetical protein